VLSDNTCDHICNEPANVVVYRPLGPTPQPRYARPMCGRARLSSDVSEIKLFFSIPLHRPSPQHRAQLERGADRSAPAGCVRRSTPMLRGTTIGRRRGDHIIRREFVALAGGAAVGWPLAARAQQKAMPVIGYLSSGSPGPNASSVAAFRQGLERNRLCRGKNVAIEYRWAQGAIGVSSASSESPKRVVDRRQCARSLPSESATLKLLLDPHAGAWLKAAQVKILEGSTFVTLGRFGGA
jgi:hypothetical protein